MGPSQRSPGSASSAARSWRSRSSPANRTVDPDRSVHSMHGYFLRPGDANKPITFGVQRLRDGRSFSARRVHAYQDGMPILSMIASFQEEDEGIDHQSAMPEGIPDPESLPSTADLLGKFDHPVARHWAYERPFDIRHVDPPLYVSAKGEQEARNAVWMKTFGPMPDDANTAPGRPGLRQRLHAAGIHPAQARTELDHPGHERGKPRPRHVVAPARAGGRMAAVRPGIPERPGCPRPCHRQDLQPGRPARRVRGPGGHGPGSDRPEEQGGGRLPDQGPAAPDAQGGQD